MFALPVEKGNYYGRHFVERCRSDRERERVRGGGAADLPGIVVDPNLPSCFYGTRVTWSFICTHEK